jgi:hypothetical protein
LKINTVHVRDVVAALWHLTSNGNLGEVYNLADTNDSSMNYLIIRGRSIVNLFLDQGNIGDLLAKIFGIKVTFMGGLKSKLATSVAMKTVAEVANDKHLKPWYESYTTVPPLIFT